MDASGRGDGPTAGSIAQQLNETKRPSTSCRARESTCRHGGTINDNNNQVHTHNFIDYKLLHTVLSTVSTNCPRTRHRKTYYSRQLKHDTKAETNFSRCHVSRLARVQKWPRPAFLLLPIAFAFGRNSAGRRFDPPPSFPTGSRKETGTVARLSAAVRKAVLACWFACSFVSYNAVHSLRHSNCICGS